MNCIQVAIILTLSGFLGVLMATRAKIKPSIQEVFGIAFFCGGMVALWILTPGCASLTSKSPTGATVVNTNALISDCNLVQGLVGGGLKLIPMSPTEKTVLADINLAIAGIINGATTNSPAQIAALISSKSATDATLAQALAPAVAFLSGLDQAALAKYGSTAWEIIGVAFAKAIGAGIAQALQ